LAQILVGEPVSTSPAYALKASPKGIVRARPLIGQRRSLG
jgi:hypothetical protein